MSKDTFDYGTNWVRYVMELKGKLHRTDEENAMLMLADVVKLYNVKMPHEVTPEIEMHYGLKTGREKTADNRDIFRFTLDQRLLDLQDPAHPGKQYWVQKGDVFDKLCEILGINKDTNFHKQIRKQEIYEEDVKGSEWFLHILMYKDIVEELFGLTVPKNFVDNPLQFFKTFCFKVMGIVCTLEQVTPFRKEEHEDLIKEHKAGDIYRKYYGGTPKSMHQKKEYSWDWIDKKVKAGDELTNAERKLRALRRHVAIHNKQPQYKRYLSSLEKSPLKSYFSNHGTKNNRKKGSVL